MIAYEPELVDGDVTQLFNLLFGNVSLMSGVRVVDVEFPDSLLARLPGPR